MQNIDRKKFPRVFAGVACLVAVMLCTSSCRVWDWMWSVETEKEVDINDLTGDHTGGNGFRSVAYDVNTVHEGTDIYYANPGENGDRIIVIDAGHQEKGNSDKEPNGPDSDKMKVKVKQGATGVATGTPEYELNLKVAIFLRDELYERGYSVVMIRETNGVDISNKERALLANKYEAAAYVRIHANSYSDPAVEGAETLCQSEDNPYPACVAAYATSHLLSEEVLDAFCAATRVHKRSVQENDDMTGINWSEVPSTIVEMGFLSNPEEDERMNGANAVYFRKQAAEGIANGIENYFAILDHGD